MQKKITILPGDGIGPEVIHQAEKIIESVNHLFGHRFTIHRGDIGAASIDKYGVPLTQDIIDACKNSDAVLLGAIGDPKYDSNPDLSIRPEQGLLGLRKALGLFTNIRPIETYDDLKEASPLKMKNLEYVDMVIYRELTGGIYFGEKTLSKDGKTATDTCSYTVEEISNVAYQAFDKAMQRSKRITLIDKANVLETSRLWRKVVQQIALKYPQVTVEYMYVDNAAMQMMLNPAQFDVVLTENMFGDIISDLASVITGSLGMLPSASLGTSSALFEPCHGSYPQAANKDIANPMATILSVAMMYDHFELFEESSAIRKAIHWALNENIVTIDINPIDYESCSVVGDLIAHYIEEESKITLNKEILAQAKLSIV